MRTPLTTRPRPRRAALVLAAGALLATAGTACEPSGPPPAFTVVPAASGADTTPGDGECADADGRCSLQAAVEEANALDTPTEITVPNGAVAAIDLTVTGSIDLVAGETWQELQAVSWTVADGAKLAVTDAQLGAVVVDGTFLARRVGLGEAGSTPISGVDALVQVSASGTALVTNAQAVAWGAPLVINAGVLSLHGATISPASSGDPTITTEPDGQTRLSATAFLGGSAATDICGGVLPQSYGYNLMPDTTCGLTYTGDRQDFDSTSFTPEVSSDARVDAIPVGTLHCGSGWDDDITAGATAVRPFDGDQDDTAACDIGARELRPT